MLPRATAERTDRESVQGPDRRADARDPAAHRALAARRRRPDPARRADDHGRLRRAPGRRRHADRVDHRRLRRARRGAHHVRDGAAPRREGRGGLGRDRRRACRCSTSTTRRTRAPTSTSTSSARTPGAYVELQGTAEGKPFDRAAADGLLDLADDGARAAVRGAGRGPRHRPAVTRPAAPRRHPLGAQAPRAARAAVARRGTELVSLDDLGIEGDPVEDGETFETNAAIKARFGLRATGLPTLADDSGLEVDALGGGAGRPDAALRRRGRHRRGEQREAAGRAGGLPPERRGARYVCVLALALPGDAGPRGGVPVITTRGHVPRPDRHGAARDRRVRLRPDLRARLRAARRPNPGAVDAGREARHLAPRPCRPADGPEAGDARASDGAAANVPVLLRREARSATRLPRARRVGRRRARRRAASASSIGGSRPA